MQFKIKICLGFAFLLCLFSVANAQGIRVFGKVTNKATGEALAGATISVKGSGTATSTDTVGNFSIILPQAGSTLVVSFVGMTPLERKIQRPGESNFSLQESGATTLTDVVV